MRFYSSGANDKRKPNLIFDNGNESWGTENIQSVKILENLVYFGQLCYGIDVPSAAHIISEYSLKLKDDMINACKSYSQVNHGCVIHMQMH